MASCNVVGNAVECGACPSGYAGDGRTGCLPLLAALDVSGAMLSPSRAVLGPSSRYCARRSPSHAAASVRWWGTGANQSGAAYVFSRDPAGWRSPTFIKSSNTEAEDAFGWTVAATETDFFVSAPWESSNGGDQANNGVTNSGALYVFR